MTQFINCYGNIESEINKLNISGISPMTIEDNQKFFQQTQFSNVKTKIMSAIQKTNLKYYYIQKEDVLKESIDIDGLHDQLFNLGFDMLCKVRFLCAQYQITIFTSLLKNGIPLRIKGKGHRLLINKLILKINGGLKYGSFRLNPNNGQLILCINSALTAYQFQNLIEKPIKLSIFLQEQFLKSKFFYQIHIFKILHLVNQIQQSYPRNPNLLNVKVLTINSSIKQIEEILRKIIPTMHLQYPFMFSDNSYSGSKILNLDQTKKLGEAIKASKCLRKALPPSIIKILKSLTQFKDSSGIETMFTQQQKKDFATKLLDPTVRYQTGQTPNVYSQIQIINSPLTWDIIDQGGFGIIFKGSIRFGFKQQIDRNKAISDEGQSKKSGALVNLFSRTIVKKQQFYSESKKLIHQKQILAKLKKSASPFVAKFFYSEQEEYKHALFIQYCAQKSLNLLKIRNNQFMTLHSKLIYLRYIAQGIKFLKDHDICHLDIKPTNILFGSGIVKLTDFGESYHPSVCQKNYRPGTSIPYAPPQSFSPDFINFNSKMDVFSFGVLMYELLYESYPFQYTRYKYDEFRRAYSQKNYSRFLCLAPEKTLMEGYGKIHYFLKYISLRCIDEDDHKRPCIQWIVIMLQYCLQIQMQLYI